MIAVARGAMNLERLAMLAFGELADAEAAEVEEHVLACSACASKLERLLDIGVGVRELVRAGKVSFPATAGLVEELGNAGLISRSYRLAPNAIVPCAVGAEDVYTVTTLEADLRGVEHVDMVRTTPAGSIRMHDVPFDAESGLVRFAVRSDLLRPLPSIRIRLELFAVDASGERKLSEYFLDHTASDNP